jgi:hypothetical protein
MDKMKNKIYELLQIKKFFAYSTSSFFLLYIFSLSLIYRKGYNIIKRKKKKMNRATQNDILRIRHPNADKRTMPMNYGVANSSSSNERGSTFIYEGSRPEEETRTPEEINRLKNMKLTRANEYNAENEEDGDDESETTKFWPVYVDPTRDDDDPTKPIDEPHETEEDLAKFRERLRSDDFQKKIKSFGDGISLNRKKKEKMKAIKRKITRYH